MVRGCHLGSTSTVGQWEIIALFLKKISGPIPLIRLEDLLQMSSARISVFALALPVALHEGVEAVSSAEALHCPLHCMIA